jgi:hypothetical protein
MRFVVSVVLLCLALFCGYGFLASFEPAANAMTFRIGYAVIGLLAATGAVLPMLRMPSHE